MQLAKKLSYAFYTIFHPFKAFWDIKYENKGNIFASLTILTAYIFTQIFREHFAGYIFNTSYPNVVNTFFIITRILVLFLLWCISNWCLTTLMDGEGSLKNIITVIGYCLTPLVFSNILVTFLSNFLTIKESMLITYIDTVVLLWTGFLILFATIVVHQYTLFKTIITSLLTVIVMMILVFIVLLCVSLVQQFFSFFDSVYKEFIYRL